MNTKPTHQSAFGLFDLLVIIAVVFILAALFLPAHIHHNGKSVRIYCASNLKQVALAFRIWEGDNGDKFPMAVYTNKLGGPLYADAGQAYRYLQFMSNEISNPKVVVCPADDRAAATNFNSDFSGQHVSYFIGLDADESIPQAFLAGDDNFTNAPPPKSCLLEIPASQTLAWTKKRHNLAGNVALADGSVQQYSNFALQQALLKTGFTTNRLLMP